MHLSSNFLENVLVVVLGGLVLKLLSYLWSGLKSGILSLLRPERLSFPSWAAKLERWKDERRRQHSHSDNRGGCTWIAAIAVVMAMFGYYAARHRSGIDYSAASEMAHQYVQRKCQNEINLLKHVTFSTEAEEQIEDEGNGRFSVRGWYAWKTQKQEEKRRWTCVLHSQDGGQTWNSVAVQKENEGR